VNVPTTGAALPAKLVPDRVISPPSKPSSIVPAALVEGIPAEDVVKALTW